MLWKWKLPPRLPRLEKLSKSSITSWVLFHGIFMTSCDKILNRDVLTRNRCHQGATSLRGTCVALVYQEPLAHMSALLCAHSVSSALSGLGGERPSPVGWACCLTLMVSPTLQRAACVLLIPLPTSLLLGVSDGDVKNASWFLPRNISATS